MPPHQGSRTVVLPALLRAAHQLLDDDPKILVDPVAVGFVPEVGEAAIRAQADALRAPRALLLRSLMVLRTRCAEDRWLQALRQGTTQYVMLGAGLDTFAWRQPEDSRQATLFFVDHPTTLAATRAALAAQARALPANLRFVACDLDAQDLDAALQRHGFDRREPAFASALGLFQYLRPASVDSVLAAVSRWAPGSEVVFSRVVPADELDGADLAETRTSASVSAQMGEPWLTIQSSQAWSAQLAGHGFASIDLQPVPEAQRRCLVGRLDGLHAPRFERLASAAVPAPAGQGARCSLTTDR